MASDRWLALTVVSSANRQGVLEALFAAGSQGIQEDGARLVTHFPASTDVASVQDAIREADPLAAVTVAEAPDADYGAWRAAVSSHRVGKVTIAPPWLASGLDLDSIVISIDPAMAFGTGEHATTRGVVRLLQRVMPLPDLVADLGAGSAVLSICAAKLGARRVVAVELDHDAISNAGENVAANGVGDRVHIMEGDAASILPLIAPVGLVLANIISSVLLALMPIIHYSLKPGGHAILSGILVDERESMLDAVRDHGFTAIAEDMEDEWWSVLLALPQ